VGKDAGSGQGERKNSQTWLLISWPADSTRQPGAEGAGVSA